MRILLVTNDYPPKPGGIQQYLGGLVAALDAEVLVLGPADGDAPPAEPGVVRHHRRFLWPTPAVRRWVLGHLGEFRPDAVLFGAPHPLAHLGPSLRRDTGVPFGVLCHGAEVVIPAAFPITRSLVRYPLRRADVTFAVSRFTTGRVERLTGRPVRYVGGGVDPVFSPGDRAFGSVIGCVSRFVPRKGQRRVLRSAARLRAAGREVSVLMVGRGRDEQALRRLADRLGVPTTFEVGVPWARLPDLYRSMDVFAMPCRSRWMGLEVEGLGLVFLEAAATGLPVLAGDSGGSPETVVPGETGFVVSSDADVDRGLAMLLGDVALARRMGAAGRQRVLAEYTWEAVAARMLEGLREAVDRA
jgi:phosphatidylinositol alpha-1,6-mannosyltransferase